MHLYELMNADDIFLDMESEGVDKEKIIKNMISRLAANKGIKNIKKIQQLVLEREKIGTTAIGKGLALPHIKTDLVNGVYGCMAYFKEGLDFRSLDDNPTNIVLLVLASPNHNDEYIKIMSQATKVFRDLQNQRIVFSKDTSEKVLDVLRKVCI